MKKIIILSLAMVIATAVAAQAADAKENWEKQCQKCHGPDGKGETKMGKKLDLKDLTDAKVQEKMTDAEMLKTIKDGKKDGEKTRMKAFGEVLNDQEMKDLVAYVRKFKH